MIQMTNEGIEAVGDMTVKERVGTIGRIIGPVDTIAKMILTQVYRPGKLTYLKFNLSLINILTYFSIS